MVKLRRELDKAGDACNNEERIQKIDKIIEIGLEQFSTRGEHSIDPDCYKMRSAEELKVICQNLLSWGAELLSSGLFAPTQLHSVNKAYTIFEKMLQEIETKNPALHTEVLKFIGEITGRQDIPTLKQKLCIFFKVIYDLNDDPGNGSVRAAGTYDFARSIIDTFGDEVTDMLKNLYMNRDKLKESALLAKRPD